MDLSVIRINSIFTSAGKELFSHSKSNKSSLRVYISQASLYKFYINPGLI
jgi:hypothetical protein